MFSDVFEFARVINDDVNTEVHSSLLKVDIETSDLGVLNLCGHGYHPSNKPHIALAMAPEPTSREVRED